MLFLAVTCLYNAYSSTSHLSKKLMKSKNVYSAPPIIRASISASVIGGRPYIGSILGISKTIGPNETLPPSGAAKACDSFVRRFPHPSFPRKCMDGILLEAEDSTVAIFSSTSIVSASEVEDVGWGVVSTVASLSVSS